jgi:hypothetical protein
LPTSLRKAIETPTAPGYGRDDKAVDAGGGINLVPGAWQPPERVTPEELAAARLWMQAYDAGSPTVAPRDLQRWLATLLGNLAKARDTGAEEIDMRVKMLALAIDDRPAKHFGKDALKLAWERFTFIPTAHELMEFFDEMESRERTDAQRLMAVLDAGSRPPPPKVGPVDIEASMRRMRDKQAAENLELAEKLGIEPTEPPPRLLGETDGEYGGRLADLARQHIAAGEKALKRDAARRRAGLPTAEALDAAREAMDGRRDPSMPKEPGPQCAENPAEYSHNGETVP